MRCPDIDLVVAIASAPPIDKTASDRHLLNCSQSAKTLTGNVTMASFTSLGFEATTGFCFSEVTVSNFRDLTAITLTFPLRLAAPGSAVTKHYKASVAITCVIG